MATESLKRQRVENGFVETKSMTTPNGDEWTQLMRLLVSTPVQSLKPKENKVFFANRDDRIVDVWKGLIQHGFLSAPVLQKTGQKWYGFISVEDIMHYMVNHFGNLTTSGEQFDFWKAVQQDNSLQSKTVNDVMSYPLTRNNPFHPISNGYSLYFAMEMMAREECLHRVPIIDENRQLKNLLTQSHVAEFLLSNLSLLGSKRSKQVWQFIEIGQEKLKLLNEHQTAITAFEELAKNHIFAMPIVDDTGKITGALSATDLKAIQSDGQFFWRLWQTCHNFLLHIKSETNEKTRPRRLVTVGANATLEEVLRQVVEHKVHRVFVVDQSNKPVGVCSLRDILKEVISAPEKNTNGTMPSQAIPQSSTQ